MTVDLSNIDKNPFRTLSELGNAFRPQDCSVQLKDGQKMSGFIRISSSGQSEVYDYRVGLLYVKVSTLGYGKDVTPEAVNPVNYCVQFHVGCMDDGEWQGWSKYMTLDECNALVKRIKTDILDDLSSVPSGRDLNDQLQPYGIFGEIS